MQDPNRDGSILGRPEDLLDGREDTPTSFRRARMLDGLWQISLIERSRRCTLEAWGPKELSMRFDNPSWQLQMR